MCSNGISFSIWSPTFQGEPIQKNQEIVTVLKFEDQLFATKNYSCFSPKVGSPALETAKIYTPEN